MKLIGSAERLPGGGALRIGFRFISGFISIKLFEQGDVERPDGACNVLNSFICYCGSSGLFTENFDTSGVITVCDNGFTNGKDSWTYCCG